MIINIFINIISPFRKKKSLFKSKLYRRQNENYVNKNKSLFYYTIKQFELCGFQFEIKLNIV